MKRISIFFLLLSAFTVLRAASTSADTMAKPQTAITDKAGLLTAEQKKSLQQIIDQLENTRETHTYLVILDSLPADQGILGFTKGIFKKWDLNENGQGKAMVMVYSRKDHAIRVEASDLTLKVLTREYIQEVIAKSIFPALKVRKDYEGLKRGLEMLAKKIENN